MAVQIEDLSTKELTALISAAKKRKTALAKRKPITTVRKSIQAAVRASGYTMEELFGGAATTTRTTPSKPRASKVGGRKLGKVPAKYRNPDDASNTWSGRGRMPLWLVAQIGEGCSADDFLIEKPEAAVLSAAGQAAASHIEHDS